MLNINSLYANFSWNVKVRDFMPNFYITKICYRLDCFQKFFSWRTFIDFYILTNQIFINFLQEIVLKKHHKLDYKWDYLRIDTLGWKYIHGSEKILIFYLNEILKDESGNTQQIRCSH